MKKRLLNYPGQKWGIARQIISHFPQHNIYLEPFFGSGSVFFNKPRARQEVINDLDAEVINLYKVIREQGQELAKLIYYTPYSREEYTECIDDRSGTDLEKARRFMCATFQGQSSSLHHKSGWRRSGIHRWFSIAYDWANVPDAILEATERLRGVEIENKNALELIPKYNSSDCLVYCDPPYVASTRKKYMYRHEMHEDEKHIKLIEILLRHSGTVILSGYDSDLYNDLLKGWHKINIKGRARNGNVTDEIIWINERYEQITLFS